jgi:hypothetical protein
MHVFGDESGDYAFPAERFDVYAQAVLICPDSQLARIDDFVNGATQRLGCDELHAAHLIDAELKEVCRFVGRGPWVLFAMVTDTELITPPDIQRFRIDQAAAHQRGLDRYRRMGGQLDEVAALTDRNVKRAALTSRISDAEFVQSHFLILLFYEALQKAVLWFQDKPWDADLASFEFIFDAKELRKLASGEKYVDQMLVPALASSMNGLDIPEQWRQRRDHPFLVGFDRPRGRVRGREVEGVVDLKAIFDGHVRFIDSQSAPGLQIADVVAHVVRRAVREPNNPAIQAAFDHLRQALSTQEGNCMKINRFRNSHPPRSLERYRHVWSAEERAA